MKQKKGGKNSIVCKKHNFHLLTFWKTFWVIHFIRQQNNNENNNEKNQSIKYMYFGGGGVKLH